MEIKELCKQYEDYTIQFRRQFHENPEVSNKEFMTADSVCRELEDMGIPYDRVVPNSVIGILEGRPGAKCLAIRADMDALPMQERTGLPFQSKNDGVMHACGHDAHTAILLGVARVLSGIRDQLKGRIYLCFQCAEEIADGALQIVEYLRQKGGVDQAIGLHVDPDLSVGQICVSPGPQMAGAVMFTVNVKGRGGHGSRPDLCVDPVKPACDMLLKVSAIPGGLTSPLEPLVSSIGQIHGGSAANIVPEEASFSGTFRYFNKGKNEEALFLMNRIVQGVAAAYGVTAEVDPWGQFPPLINDEKAAALAITTVEGVEGLEAALLPLDCGSENFGDFLAAFGGMFAKLGTAPKDGSGSPLLHNPEFRLDEGALKYGVEFLSSYAFSYMTDQ